MTSLRRLLLDHRALAIGLASLALAMRLLVPTGFMVGTVDGRPMLQLCSGVAPVAAMPTAHGAAMAGMTHGRAAEKSGHSGTEMPCPYAALTLAATAPTDPVLLALAIAFVLALGVRAARWPLLRGPAFLRPPMRGPPRAL